MIMQAQPSYTIKEAAVLAGMSERTIRNEIGRGVIRVARKARGRATAVTLPKGAIVYFRLLKDMPVRLTRRDRGELYRLLSGKVEKVGSWHRERDALRRGILTLDAKAIWSDLDSDLRAYDAGLKKVASHPETLGGDPVFAGTRISVRHIGKLALRGLRAGEIQADFPSLSDDDIAFAAVFSRLKPAPGRPPKLRVRRETA